MTTYGVEVDWSPRREGKGAPDLSATERRHVTVEARTDQEALLLSAQMVNGEGRNHIAALPTGMVTGARIIRTATQFLAEIDHGNDVMVALVPPLEVSLLLHDPKGEALDDHHITLVYVGEAGEVDVAAVHDAVRDWTVRAGWRGLTGRVSGFGVFKGEGTDVLYASWDIPHVEVFRTELAEALRAAGVRFEDVHGYVAHETIRYSDVPVTSLPELPGGLPERVVFTSVVVAVGDDWTTYDLSPGSSPAARAASLAFAEHPDVARAWQEAAQAL